jgi:hypothetical protein
MRPVRKRPSRAHFSFVRVSLVSGGGVSSLMRSLEKLNAPPLPMARRTLAFAESVPQRF